MWKIFHVLICIQLPQREAEREKALAKIASDERKAKAKKERGAAGQRKAGKMMTKLVEGLDLEEESVLVSKTAEKKKRIAEERHFTELKKEKQKQKEQNAAALSSLEGEIAEQL